MANLKLHNNNWEASGVYDIDQQKTQRQINAEVSDLKSAINDPVTGLATKAPVIIDTASGAIAFFPDGADGMPIKQLTVNIEPVQAAGTPTPETPLPISGWTGCNVTRTGKNLWGGATLADDIMWAIPSAAIDTGALTVEYSGNASASHDFTRYGKFKENTRYTLVLTFRKTSIDGANMRIRYTDGSSDVLNTSDDPTVKKTYVYVTTAGKTVKSIAKANQGGKTIIYYDESGLFEGVLPAVDFEPYQGNTYPIAFPASAGTVYGGTLNGTNGVLTVDRAKLTFNGSENWGIAQGDVFYLDSALPSGYARNALGDWLCNKYAVVNGVLNTSEMHDSRPDDSITNQPGQPTSRRYDRILIRDSTYATVEDFKASLAQTNLEIVFTVPNSTAYTLPTTEVTTLLGTNNIWADCGPVSVDYPADTKLYIQKINAPTDDDMTADTQIDSGKYFLVSNNLYLSTTTIPAGDPIKPGTNCTKTNLAAALNALNT